jgi:hypothetical protein
LIQLLPVAGTSSVRCRLNRESLRKPFTPIFGQLLSSRANFRSGGLKHYPQQAFCRRSDRQLADRSSQVGLYLACIASSNTDERWRVRDYKIASLAKFSGKMISNSTLNHLRNALAICLIIAASFQSTAFGFGRGTGGVGRTDDGPQDIRDPHAWNGDAFVSPEDKAARYKNYKLPNAYPPMNVNPNAGINAGNNGQQLRNNQAAGGAAGGNAGAGGQAYIPAPPINSTAPAHIQPDQYHYFVQTFIGRINRSLRIGISFSDDLGQCM